MAKQHAVDEEIYTHEYLWRSSSALEECLRTDPGNSHHLEIPALLTTFLAYEAFINFCGFVLLPGLWKEEKKNFKGQGLEQKLEAIVKKLPDFTWDKGRNPYQTIKALERFRHLAAHGKVQDNQYITERQPDGSHFRWQHDWDDFLTDEAVIDARAQVKQFCQSLVDAMRRAFDEEHLHAHLFFDAFEGPLASAGGKTH